MSKYELTTAKGLDFFEVSSAFQKCIRRGLEEEALYWAVEASEDVGLAQPGIVAEIHALYQHYKLQAVKKEDKNQPERLFLTHAVLLLCRAPKSRLVDWMLIAQWRLHDHVHLPIPDFAYDKHNEAGRRQGRGWKHFFEEGSHLENMADVPGEAEARLKAMQAISSPEPGLFDLDGNAQG
jgi:replication-associated recombination protein RarA